MDVNKLNKLRDELWMLIGNEDLTEDKLWEASEGLLPNLYDFLLELEREELKPHPDYDFVNHDRVYVENGDGSVDFFILTYEPETADWVLLPFKDKYFTEFDDTKQVEPLSAYGYDIIERMEEMNLDEFE